MFIVGWNDASQGPLLPLLQEYYQVCVFVMRGHSHMLICKVDYVIISLIWIAIAVGVIVAAVSNVFLADILGFGIVRSFRVVSASSQADFQLTPLGALCQSIAYVLMCWGGPYPLFVIAYFFAGLGIGWLVSSSTFLLDLKAESSGRSSQLLSRSNAKRHDSNVHVARDIWSWRYRLPIRSYRFRSESDRPLLFIFHYLPRFGPWNCSDSCVALPRSDGESNRR